MIAEEWYGVAYSPVSDRVRRLERRLDALSPSDADLVESLVQRLLPKSESVFDHDPPNLDWAESMNAGE